MRFARMGAGDERVQSFNLVSKPVLHEEIERPVGDRRLRAETFRAQHVEYLVGAQRTVPLEQDFENTAPNRRELQPSLTALSVYG